MRNGSWSRPAGGRGAGLDVIVLGVAFSFSLAAHGLAPGSERLLYATALVGLAASLASVIAAYGRVSAQRAGAGLLVAHLAALFWFHLPAASCAWESRWHHVATLSSVGPHHFGKAFVAINLFGFLLTLAYALSRGQPIIRLVSRLPRWRVSLADPAWIHAALLAFGVAFSFYVALAGGLSSVISIASSGRSGATPWGADGNFGTQFTPGHVIAQSMIVACTVVSLHVLFFGNVSRARRMLLTLLTVTAVSWIAMSTGTRSTLVLMVAPAVVEWVRRATRSRGRVAMTVSAIVVVGVLLSAAIREYRQAGSSQDVAWNLNEAISALDNDFYTLTAHALAIGDDHGVRTHDSVALEILAGPIPRAIWPGKPRGRAVVEFSWWIWGVDIDRKGGNTLPSIVGQYYLSWGWLGVLEIATALGVLLAAADRVMRQTQNSVFSIIWSALVVWVAVSYRSIGFGYLTSVIMLVATVSVTSRVALRRTGSVAATPTPRG